MQYTELRGQIYWFRRRAPEPLKPGMKCLLGDVEAIVGKNGYVRVSLKTSDRREAARMSRRFAHLLDEAAERRKALKVPSAPVGDNVSSDAPSPEEVQHAADSMYAMLLAADENTAKNSFAQCLEGDTDEEVREPDRYIWSSTDLPPVTTTGQVELLKKFRNVFSFFLQATTGKTISEITPDLLPFADAFRRYVLAMEKRKALEVVPTPSLPSTKVLWSWDQAFEYYVQQRAGLSESTLANYRTAWKALSESAKCPPEKLTATKVVVWRDSLLKALKPRTTRNRLTFAGAIWRESRVNGKIERSTLDPFEGLRVRVDENTGTSRKEFSKAELEMIFSAPPLQTARAVSIQSGYWLPILALYHGARLEELTGLEVRDIEDSDVGLIVHIRENEVRPRLKNRKRSERSIPLHPILEKLGFARYVKAARAANIKVLFPSFARGATFGEEFVTYVKKLITPLPGRLVGMHCFRHNWETARRTARLDTSASNYITGRRIDDGSSGQYGGPAGLVALKDELRKIDFGITHLKAPPVSSKELMEQVNRRNRILRRNSTGAKK